jgi:hypothetical protein
MNQISDTGDLVVSYISNDFRRMIPLEAHGAGIHTVIGQSSGRLEQPVKLELGDMRRASHGLLPLFRLPSSKGKWER